MKPHPTLHILIVDHSENELSEIKSSIVKHSALKEGDLSVAKSPEEAQQHYINNLDINAVFLDWELDNSSELLKWMKQFRPHIPVYILAGTEDGTDIANQIGDLYDDYFTKNELKVEPQDILGRILHDFDIRRATPFWSAFENYVDDFSDSWHTPGHSRGASFRNSEYLKAFYDYWGEKTFASDLSVSVEYLGSLLDTSGFVRDAEKKAAKTFGTKHTFFSTNGSSTSNKIMLQSIIKPGDKLIVDRNCHKSIHYGCIQAGANVAYLKSEYSSELGIFAPPALQEIEKQLQDHPDAKVIVITGCTYDGLLIDVRSVIALAHKYSKPDHRINVFIDEAWFAYSGFHPAYEYHSAIRSKADYVTHSAHKVLSAFSQSSYLHINDPDFDEDFFREIFNIYTSTSPQYQMLASLDVASMQMEMEGYKLVQIARQKAQKFINDVNTNLKTIKVLNRDDFATFFPSLKTDRVDHDILKVTLDIRGLNKPIREIHEFLREEGKLEVEKYTHSTITVLFTIGVEQDKVNRLYSALIKLEKRNEDSNHKYEGNSGVPGVPEEIELDSEFSPYSAFYCKDSVSRSLDELKQGLTNKKYIASRLVTPYPPGIPVLVPSQILTKEHIDYLEDLIKQGVEIHGCRDTRIYVIEQRII
ncbi:MAG: beta-eliminating lyase-related protein [Bacteroidales bacterium]|nr:beta-eliminating lyase-related protein [Bacteroidales bacterium]